MHSMKHLVWRICQGKWNISTYGEMVEMLEKRQLNVLEIKTLLSAFNNNPYTHSLHSVA